MQTLDILNWARLNIGKSILTPCGDKDLEACAVTAISVFDGKLKLRISPSYVSFSIPDTSFYVRVPVLEKHAQDVSLDATQEALDHAWDNTKKALTEIISKQEAELSHYRQIQQELIERY